MDRSATWIYFLFRLVLGDSDEVIEKEEGEGEGEEGEEEWFESCEVVNKKRSRKWNFRWIFKEFFEENDDEAEEEEAKEAEEEVKDDCWLVITEESW